MASQLYSHVLLSLTEGNIDVKSCPLQRPIILQLWKPFPTERPSSVTDVLIESENERYR